MNDKIPYKKIYFVWSRWGGGATMGCYQPLMSCEKNNISAKVIDISYLKKNIIEIKSSAIFCFKTFLDTRTINKLKNNKNIIISYPGDAHESVATRHFKNTQNYNGIIVSNKKYKNILDTLKTQSKVEVIPANHDYFLDMQTYEDLRNNKFSLYFGGSKKPNGKTQGEFGLSDRFVWQEGYFHSLRHMFQYMKTHSLQEKERYVLDIAMKKKCKHINNIVNSHHNPSKYSCHYAIRAPWIGNYRQQWNTKTAGKVSTAAASGANIITSLDPAVRELIDENYPYSIDTETDDFKQNYQQICDDMILYAKRTFNTKVWAEGLKILKDVRVRTTTENITFSYIKFMNKLWEIDK